MKNKFIIFTVLLASYLTPQISQSDEMCWSKRLSAQDVVYVGDNMDTQIIELWSYNQNGDFKTKAQVLFQPDQSIQLKFVQKPGEVSLAYNLYALLIEDEKGEVYFQDFTNACLGNGIAVFPGDILTLARLKLKQSKYLKVYVWGFL